MRLVHEHVDRADDRVVHDDRRDLLGERLDELDGRSLDDLDDLLRERRVAERERQVVARRRAAGVEVHDDVRDEHLALGTLVVEHAVVALRSDTGQAHLIERPTVLVADALPAQPASSQRLPYVFAALSAVLVAALFWVLLPKKGGLTVTVAGGPGNKELAAVEVIVDN